MTKPAKANKPTAGRPPFQGEAMASRSFRCSDRQFAKLEKLGGSAWIRVQIDQAPLAVTFGGKSK